MREILFRAKLKSTGRWVQGDLVRLRDGPKAIPHIYGHGEVVSETVGQYTGLTDIVGCRIFEGDIVEYMSEYGQIAYQDGEAMFGIVFDTWCTDFDHVYRSSVEVIGNIHDNPELLEGGDDGN